jgi:hypothetical protein
LKTPPKIPQPPKIPITLKPYTKPAKTPEDLLAHLEARGLRVKDRAAALSTLRSVGYYRLLIYMRALQSQPSKAFAPGTSFENVVALYNFDRELRLLCLDAIERIEVALRASIVNSLSVPECTGCGDGLSLRLEEPFFLVLINQTPIRNPLVAGRRIMGSGEQRNSEPT